MTIIEKLGKRLASDMPKLHMLMRMAKMRQSPAFFVTRNLKLSLSAGFTLGFLMFLMFDKFRGRDQILTNILFSFIVFAIVGSMTFVFFLNTVTVYIKKRENEMNKEVLFAGRYLLVKLQSGTPFFNCLCDAATSYGTSAKFFKEIVEDVETGTSLEEAMHNAASLCPSKTFQKILWQINNALRSGIDVTRSLKAILQEIMKEQLIEIQRYGKKLSSLSMFYMLIAIIVPSLGMALFVVLSSFINLRIKMIHLVFVVFLLCFLQFIFLSIFRSIRPNINM